MKVVITLIPLPLHELLDRRWVTSQRLPKVTVCICVDLDITFFVGTSGRLSICVRTYGQTLYLDKLSIDAVVSNQRIMVPLFHNSALAHDDDVVRLADGGKFMGNDNRGAAFGCSVESLLNDGFGVRVKRARRFVQKEDLGLRDDAASNGDALALPTGKKPATLSNLGIIAIGELGDEVVRE